jgi:hypothetical protein
MTNTLSPPLDIKHEQIDPTILEVIRKIDEIASKQCQELPEERNWQK